MMLKRNTIFMVLTAIAATCLPPAFAANILEVYFAPFPEDDMQTSLKAINAFQGNIGDEIRTATSMVAGNDDTIIYYDQWEDGYEGDISSPTQATTEVWGDGNSTNGIPPGYASDDVDAGSIINLEATIDVTRNEVIFEYDGRDKIASTLPISLSRAMYPIDPGEVIAEAGTALAVNLHGTNYVIAAGWGTGLPLYTNEVFEYSALYIMADYDFTYVEVDKDADGIYETTAWLDQGQTLFVNGGVRVGARARGNVPFQCHLVTGDIYSNYETRWYTQWPLEKWSSDYYTPVGSRTNSAGTILYKSIVFFYNANTSAINVFCETANSTTIVAVAASSVSGAYTIPANSGARFRTTNGLPFFASEVVDGSTPAYSGQLQDYDWGFSVLPADALTTMGIVSWGPGYGVTGSATTNGSPAWVIAMSNTILYVDYDGDPTTGPLTDPLGNKYNFTTNMTRFQYAQLFDNTDTNQTGMRFYTLDGTKISSAWGEDPGSAEPGLPYLDAGNELMPFPSILAKKYSILLIDLNTNGVPDPGDSLEFQIDVYNVGFATANNVIFQDTPPTNTTSYSTNSSTVNGVAIFDDLPPRLTRFPFDEGGYNIGTIEIRGTSRVTYVTTIVNAMPSNFTGYIHNNATVADSNGNWIANSFTNVMISGMTITKTASTTNLLNPGDPLTYTITVANTGQLTYTGVRLEDALPEGVTYVNGTTEIVYPMGVTNTYLDRFNVRAFTNTLGTLKWLNEWQEVGEADGPGSGSVQVAPDTNPVPIEAYSLYVGGSNRMAWRSADLSGHSSAFLSFDYRRCYLDAATDYIDVYISTNNWVGSNYLVRFQGAATDTNYLSTNIEISAYISTNTSIRFQSSRSAAMLAEDRLYVDNFMISLIGSNVTFAGGSPPVLFNGLTLPPSTSIVVRFDVTVNNPATATQFVNTARVRAEQHKSWLYAYHVTNRVNARASLQLFKTNSPSGLVGPGSNILYTIRIVNTGDVSQTDITLEDILPPGVTYVPNSAEVWRPFLHTNFVRELFDVRAYTNNNGSLNWLGDWTEVGDDNDPLAGTIQVANDGDSVPAHVYALFVSTADSIIRLADLGGGYTNAWLSLQYRRQGPEAGEYVRIDASANGGGSWTEVGRINGPGTDSSYYTSNMNITAYIATNTAIRLIGVGLEADDYIWFDDIRITFSGSNATNDLLDPPTMFQGYTLPPYTSMVVTLRATVDDPPVSTQMINTARVQSTQHPEWLEAYATNYQNFSAYMSVAKTSSLAGANWPMYYTNTYTITLVNTGLITMTGISVTDALPAGVSYVPGSAVVVSPGNQITNISTNVTTNVFSETVSDQFDSVSYANNDGTTNWLNNWTEVGDNNNPNSGNVRVQTDTGTTNSLVFRDTAADNDYANRALSLARLPGLTYTNVTLRFAYRRVAWDANDLLTITVSTNNFAAQSNEVYRIGGAAVTDAGYTEVSTNITSYFGTNLYIRLKGGPNFANGDMIFFNYITIAYSGYILETNFTTNVFWSAVTNAGGAPPPVAAGYSLPTGQIMTVTLKATMDLPTSYTQFLNTAIVNSYQQGQREAYATDRVARLTIGDFVWNDSNTNGIQDAGESGISNVTVRLYDGRTNLLATTATGTNGYYLFAGWPGTNYFVEFVAPTGYWFTLRDQGGSDTNDSDTDPTTGRTVVFTNVVTTNDLKWDAGLYRPPGSIGDWVWLDNNTNGIQNVGETAVTGVVVRLYNANSNLLATTTNDATGYYSFTGLDSGYYFLQFLISSNYTFTLQNQGGSDTNDSDVDASGYTSLFFLPPGTNDMTWDAGLAPVRRGLRITKASDSGGTCWDPGETGTYTIVVFNTGTVAQTGVTVEDVFPAGMSFLTNSINIWAPTTGNTGTPPTLAYGYTLPPGQAMTVTVRAVISKPSITNRLLNTASTYSASQPTLYASVTDCVVYADLGVVKDVSHATPSTVQIIEYRVTITNKGPDTATGVQIYDELPTEVQYNSHSNGTYDDGTHLWTIGTLPVSASTTLWINVTVREGTAGLSITNWASVYTADQYDPVTTNNQDNAIIKPTIITLARFEVLSADEQSYVEWETAYEHGTVGFYLWRKDDGAPDFIRLNDSLLPGVLVAPQGGIYRYRDATAKPGRIYTYRLDEVEMGGSMISYGPFTVTIPQAGDAARSLSAGAEPEVPYVATPRESGFTRQRLAENEAALKTASLTPARSVKASLETSLMSGAPPALWPTIKITTDARGVYLADAETLASLVGEPENTIREAITDGTAALSCGGTACSYLPAAEGLYFYAGTVDTIYTTNNVFWLTWTGGVHMSSVGGIVPVAVEGGSFTETFHAERNTNSMLAQDLDPESDYWFWNYLIASPAGFKTNYLMRPPAVAASSADAQLVARFLGGSSTGVTNEHHLLIKVNGTQIGETRWTGLGRWATTSTFSQALLADNVNTVTVTSVLDSGAPYSVAYVDSFDLTYQRRFEADDNLLVLRGDTSAVVSVSGFKWPDIHVLNVSDPAHPVELEGLGIDEWNGDYRASFVPETPFVPYAAFALGHGLKPSSMTAYTSAALRAETNTARYIVITVPSLAAAAQALADYRRTESGLATRVVMLEDIYNEFGFGLALPSAIRSFLSYAKEHWDPADMSGFYVVLAGEGTFDYLNYSGSGQNIVPAKMVSTPDGLGASDNWYVDFDSDYVPDMAIGRLPVLNTNELNGLLADMIGYESNEGGAWRQKVLLTADDPDDGGDFNASSESVGELVPRDYQISKAYMSTAGVSGAKTILFNAVNSGSAFVNYFGHGGIDRMANEGLLTTANASSLTNSSRLTVLVALTCSIGQYSLPGYDCLSEVLLLSKGGGAAAVWAPSTLQYNQSGTVMANHLYTAAFRESQIRFGDAIRKAKEDYATDGIALYALDIYNLLGDPAMPLKGAAFMNTDTSFGHWKNNVFTGSQLTNSTVSGDDADPDADGIANLMEYATGWDPFAANSNSLIRIWRDGVTYPMTSGDAVFEYQRRKGATDVSFVLQSSQAMAGWDDASGYVVETSVTDDGNGLTETVHVQVKVPPAEIESHLFLRLMVQRD